VPLIASHRHYPEDLETWRRWVATDALMARSPRLENRARRSLDDLATFAAHGPCYVGSSWGKESTVLAHLTWRLEQERGIRLPVIWVRSSLWSNPDCDLVRDAFLAQYPIDYDEITTYQEHWGDTWVDAGYALARRLYGDRHVSGIRAQESTRRRKRMQHYGASSKASCAPIGWWKIEEVYGYLEAHQLPVHPAYACTRRGLLERASIRTDCLYGVQGTGFGRHDWELEYYGPEMDAIYRIVEGVPHPWMRRPWPAHVLAEALRWRLDQQERARRAIAEAEAQPSAEGE